MDLSEKKLEIGIVFDSQASFLIFLSLLALKDTFLRHGGSIIYFQVGHSKWNKQMGCSLLIIAMYSLIIIVA